MFKLKLLPLFICIMIIVAGCGDSDKEEGDSSGVKGYVQKGPFIQGSEIFIQELSDTLIPTGTSFTTETQDDFGAFEMQQSFSSRFLEIKAEGFYFNEVSGKLSAANISFKVITDLNEDKPANINILTTLERERIKYLMSEENMDFGPAREKAEKEILNIFNINDSVSFNFQEMDISKDGPENAILLAISSVLQGDNTEAQLSELISKLSLDIKEDGVVDDSGITEKLKESGKSLNLEQIRLNLEQRYSGLGLTNVIIPPFEDYVDSDGDTLINKYDFTLEFSPVENAELSQSYNSEEIVVVLPVDIEKADASVIEGVLLINGEESGESAEVLNGDKIAVSLDAPNEYSQVIKSEVTVSYSTFSNSGEFVISSRSEKYFTLSFEVVSEADPETVYTSNKNIITLPESIESADASVSAGSIVVNGEDKGSETEVKNGDEVQIALQSSDQGNTSVSSELEVAFGNETESATFSVHTRISTPASVSAGQGTFQHKIVLEWADVDGAKEYELYRSQSSDGTFTMITRTVNTSYEDFDVADKAGGTSFFYKVKAFRDDSESHESSVAEGFRKVGWVGKHVDQSVGSYSALKNEEKVYYYRWVDASNSYYGVSSVDKDEKLFVSDAFPGTYAINKTVDEAYMMDDSAWDKVYQIDGDGTNTIDVDTEAPNSNLQQLDISEDGRIFLSYLGGNITPENESPNPHVLEYDGTSFKYLDKNFLTGITLSDELDIYLAGQKYPAFYVPDHKKMYIYGSDNAWKEYNCLPIDGKRYSFAFEADTDVDVYESKDVCESGKAEFSFYKYQTDQFVEVSGSSFEIPVGCSEKMLRSFSVSDNKIAFATHYYEADGNTSHLDAKLFENGSWTDLAIPEDLTYRMDAQHGVFDLKVEISNNGNLFILVERGDAFSLLKYW